MNPIGILMREHRLIERIIPPLKNQLNKLDEKMIDPILIANAIKFFTHYTDLTHHGKEENILFRELAKKELSSKAEQTMKELTQDHDFARNIIKGLTEANSHYIEGDLDSLTDIRENLINLIIFYPEHIAKEDKTFFHPVMAYFNTDELDKMVQEFWEYDRKLIDVGYKKVVDEISLYFQDLTRWVCTICGYLYDPETASHKETGANIPFQELPPDFLCSFCFSPKEKFEKQIRII